MKPGADKSRFDAIVIGSGFGGAITACRLAQAGMSVCLLEKGRRWLRTDFPRSPGAVSRHIFTNAGDQPGRGFIEYLRFKTMDVIQGTGLGGGSLHYFNVHKPAPALIFDQPCWPRSTDARRMKPYYALAADMLGAKTLTAEAGHRVPPRTEAFNRAVASIGRQPEPVPICVELDADSPTTCQHCGNCLLGCHVHAKNTLDLNYIPLAEAHGAQVLTGHKAVNITPEQDGYRVTAQYTTQPEQENAVDGIRHLFARKVILAAGTLGTNELLLRCKHKFGTLPRLSACLGHGYSGNGDFLFAGTRYRRQLVDPGSGPSITTGVGFEDKPGQYIYIEDLGYPDPFIQHFNALLPTGRRVPALARQIYRYFASPLGGRLQFELNDVITDGYLTNFLPYLGMGTDAADGRLLLNRRGELELKWSISRSLPMFRSMIRHMEDLSRRSGGRFVNSFLWQTPLLRLPLKKTLTAHSLGGCAMSDTPATGVTNDAGEVWGYPGLYVADGALMPMAIGVNPSATISAFAERVAFRIIHNPELTEKDRARPANHRSETHEKSRQAEAETA